jgi:hypothetical protein
LLSKICVAKQRRRTSLKLASHARKTINKVAMQKGSIATKIFLPQSQMPLPHVGLATAEHKT